MKILLIISILGLFSFSALADKGYDANTPQINPHMPNGGFPLPANPIPLTKTVKGRDIETVSKVNKGLIISQEAICRHGKLSLGAPKEAVSRQLAGAAVECSLCKYGGPAHTVHGALPD